MQCNATGIDTMNATVPLHRCATDTQPGVVCTPGSRPHIHSADSNCSATKNSATVASHVFICNMPEKPNRNSGFSAGVCALA